MQLNLWGICRLETAITPKQTKTEGTVYRIISEKIWSKPTDEITTRKSMLDFDGKEPVMVRSGQEDFLSDDVSIMIARNKKIGENMRVVNFNKEIVTILMRFFMDSKLNKNGGTLIFSTHYPELLDECDRNDSIFIIRNRDRITVENLCMILKRNDIKRYRLEG